MSCCGSCGAGKPCESSCAAQPHLPGDDPNPFAADCDHMHPPEVPTMPCPSEGKRRRRKSDGNPFEAGETARVLYEAPRERAEECRRSPMVAGSCGPFARIERDPEVFAACRRMAENIGPIDDLEDAWHLAAPQLSKYDQEVGLVVCLSHQGELREVPVEISLGQRSRVAVDPADVLRAVILSGASSWIFLHCHPSGHSAKPSPADIELTKTLQRSNDAAFGKMRGVEPTVVFIGHGVVTAKELGDARTGKVKRMAK